MLSIGSYLSQLFAAICIFLGCMNTYFFVANTPKGTTLQQYFSGITINLWPIAVGAIILFLMEIMHQLNFIRITAPGQPQAAAKPTPTTPISRIDPTPPVKAPIFPAKEKEASAPVYFAINTPPPPERPIRTQQPEVEEQISEAQPESDDDIETAAAEPPMEEELPQRPSDPSLNFFKMD